MSIPKMVSRIMSTAEKFSPRQTEEILKKLAFTAERRALLNNPEVQKVIAHPATEKGYIFGSMASRKTSPSDVDFLAINSAMNPDTPRAVAESRYDSIASILDKIDETGTKGTIDAHMVERTDEPGDLLNNFGGGGVREFITDLIKEGRARYGKDYKFKRIIGAAPVLPFLNREDRNAST